MLHDLLGLSRDIRGQTAVQNFVGQFPLVGLHLAQRQTMPVHGRIVPEDAFTVPEIIGRLGFLLSIQAGQPIAASFGYFRRSFRSTR